MIICQSSVKSRGGFPNKKFWKKASTCYFTQKNRLLLFMKGRRMVSVFTEVLDTIVIHMINEIVKRSSTCVSSKWQVISAVIHWGFAGKIIFQLKGSDVDEVFYLFLSATQHSFQEPGWKRNKPKQPCQSKNGIRFD